MSEYYDILADAFQMKNAASALGADAEGELRARLDALRACSGQGDQQACGGNGP